jgi:hypothetical protein
MEKGYPLILVLYLDRELMKNKEIMFQFSEYVDKMIIEKEANVMAFFIPTDGEERIECINPIQVEDTEMDRIYTIIEDLKSNFDVDVKDTLDND